LHDPLISCRLAIISDNGWRLAEVPGGFFCEAVSRLMGGVGFVFRQPPADEWSEAKPMIAHRFGLARSRLGRDFPKGKNANLVLCAGAGISSYVSQISIT
jgi:hypothetical protein